MGKCAQVEGVSVAFARAQGREARLDEWPEPMRKEHEVLLRDLNGAEVAEAFRAAWKLQDWKMQV